MSATGCRRPYRKGGASYRCNACDPCRSYRSFVWTGRMMLEAQKAPASFVTLTYDEEHNPGGNLNPDDLQKFLKRVRTYTYPTQIRFYACGEYGEKTWRPHYHLVIFGPDILKADSAVRKSWRYGYVQVVPASPEAMRYVAGYLQKGMTRRKDQRLEGRYPEFSRMSLRPGLGLDYVKEQIVPVLHTVPGKAALKSTGCPPNQIRIQGKKYPLGHYLNGKLLDILGVSKAERTQAAGERALTLPVPVEKPKRWMGIRQQTRSKI